MRFAISLNTARGLLFKLASRGPPGATALPVAAAAAMGACTDTRLRKVTAAVLLAMPPDRRMSFDWHIRTDDAIE
jgi:hypothetical protein